MKSRFAILSLLVSGMLFSTAGAGLALQGGGSAQSGTNASVAQYATPTPTPPGTTSTPTPTPPGTTATPTPTPGEGGVLPAEENNAPSSAPSPAAENNVAPGAENNTTTQPTRQQAAAASTSQLPFTGFAAIPVLLGGLALLSGGLVLRRRTRTE